MILINTYTMRKFILTLALVFTSVVCYSQHVSESGLLDNVYTNVLVGGTVPTNDLELDNIRPQFSIEVGKNLTTVYTTGFEFKTAINTTGVKTVFDEMSASWLHKINILNLVNGYSTRKLDINTVAGFGWGHNMVYRDNYGVFSAGLEFTYSINKSWAVLVKPSIEWENAEQGLNVNNSNLSLSVGASFRFSNRDGSYGFLVCDRDKLYANNIQLNEEINRLRAEKQKESELSNNRINELLSINSDLAKALKKCEEREVVVNEVIVTPIQFKQGSSDLATSKATIKALAETIKNSGERYSVIGYASEEGPTEFNQELSFERAVAVADMLVEYGVDPAQLSIEGKGETAKFGEPEMNRIVIIE